MPQIDLGRELLEQLAELKRVRKQAIRKGEPAVATAATAQMVQIAKMISGFAEAAQAAKDAKQDSAKQKEVRFVVRYEDPVQDPRERCVADLVAYFEIESELAEFVVAELERAKKSGEWEAEYHAQSNQKLLPEAQAEVEAKTEGRSHQARPER